MRFRKLRIAFSAVCVAVCLMVIALWVRSYWRADYLAIFTSLKAVPTTEAWQSTREIGLSSWKGIVNVQIFSNVIPKERESKRWIFFSEPEPEDGAYWHWTGFQTTIPHWSLVLLTTTLGAVPWIHWSKKFTLRTLLIATTLVAVALGFVVWIVR